MEDARFSVFHLLNCNAYNEVLFSSFKNSTFKFEARHTYKDIKMPVMMR